MKRLLFLLYFMFALVTSWAQKTTVQANIIRAKDEFWLKANQVTDIVTDTSFIAASNLKLATQLAVKKYTDSRIGGRAYSTATVPTTGYVIKWDGTKWAPAVDAGTTYTGGTGISIAGTVITNTGITGASTAGGDVSGTFSNLQIAANAVGTTEIADNSVSASKIGVGQVTLDKIAQAGATSGQAIVFNGTGWAPATISGSSGGTITGSGSNGRIAYWDGTTNLTSSSNLQTDGNNLGVGTAVNSNYNVDIANKARLKGLAIKPSVSGGRVRYVQAANIAVASAGVNILNTRIPWGAATGYFGVELSYFNNTGSSVNTLNGKITIEGYIFSSSGIYVHGSILGNWDLTRSQNIQVAKNSAGELCVLLGTEASPSTTLRYWLEEIKASENLVLTGDAIWATSSTNLSGDGYTNIASCGETLRAKTVPMHLNGLASAATINNVLQLGNSSGAGDAQVGIRYTVNTSVSGLLTDETGVTFTSYARRSGSNNWWGIRFGGSDLFSAYSSGRVGINVAANTQPAGAIQVNGMGATSATNSLVVQNSTGTSNSLLIRDDGVLTLGQYPNTLNTSGVPVNILSTSTAGILESHTPAELLSAAGGITGSGAATRIAYYTGPNTVTSSANLIYDSFNNRVGIGAVPQQNLHVVGNVRVTALDTDGSAPTTSGTTRMVLTDGNGDLSFGNMPQNLATSNLTATGSYTFSLGDNTTTFDVSGSTAPIASAVIYKGKADASNSYQPLTFNDAAGNNIGAVFCGVTGFAVQSVGRDFVIGSDTKGWNFKNTGILQHPVQATDPTSTGMLGATWFNNTTGRYKFRMGNGVRTVATLEDDLSGTNGIAAGDVGIAGATYAQSVDAFSASRTVTVGGDMTEGRDYYIHARRNNSNSVTVNAASGYTLELDGDASIGITTFTMNVGETLLARRYGTLIYIKR